MWPHYGTDNKHHSGSDRLSHKGFSQIERAWNLYQGLTLRIFLYWSPFSKYGQIYQSFFEITFFSFFVSYKIRASNLGSLLALPKFLLATGPVQGQ